MVKAMRWVRRAAGSMLVAAALLFGPLPAQAVDVQRVVSPGGLEAWLVADHTNPIIALSLAFRGGAALDPDGKEGLASMVASTLDEGAGDLDSQSFQRRLEDLAITLRFQAGRDTIGGHLRTLTKNRDTAFDLLRLALTVPRFDPEPVSRIRAQIVAELKDDLEDPNVIASRKLGRILFPSHPYGRPVEGTLKSVAGLTADDLRRFVKRRLARDNMVIGVVGDITAAQLAPLLDSTFGGLPEKPAPWTVPDVLPHTDGRTVVVQKPVPQSAILFAQKGLKRNDPRFYTATVLNYALGGGGFTSRLYAEVREKRGLAYSVYTRLYPLDHAALILGSAGTANGRVGETVAIIREVWSRLAKKGVTEKELRDAKTFLTGSFPLRFSSSGRIASILTAMQLEDLGIDYLDRRNKLIEAVTLDDVNRLAKRLLDPQGLTMVVVGEPDGVIGTN